MHGGSLVALLACAPAAHAALRAAARPAQRLHASARPARFGAPALCAVDQRPRLAQANALAAWVEQCGGVSAVKVTASERVGLGLATARDLRRGETLLAVPESLGLSAESLLRSDIGTWVEEFDPELADYAFIALALLHERRLGEQSEQSPWLAVYPALLPAAGLPDLPLTWADAEYAQLEAATTAGAARRRAAARADFAWLQEHVFDAAPMIFPAAVFSEPAYAAALALAISRSVPVLDDAGEARLVLLPLLDLPNHAASASASVAAAKAGGGFFGQGAAAAAVSLVASADLPAGSAVTLRYGGGTAGELLLDHGFVEEPVAPLAALDLALDAEDANLDVKLDILEQVGLGAQETWLLAEDGEPDPALLGYLRLKAVTAADAFILEPVFLDAVWGEHLQLPLSQENEAAALGEALAKIDAGLGGLAGTVQDDLRTLAEQEGGSRASLLAAVRYAERRALQASSRWFDARLAALGSLEYYQERRLASLGLNPVESEDELDALRAAGRQYSASDYGDW